MDEKPKPPVGRYVYKGHAWPVDQPTPPKVRRAMVLEGVILTLASLAYSAAAFAIGWGLG